MRSLTNNILENAFANKSTIDAAVNNASVQRRIGFDDQNPDYRYEGYLHGHASQLMNMIASNICVFGINCTSSIVGP